MSPQADPTTNADGETLTTKDGVLYLDTAGNEYDSSGNRLCDCRVCGCRIIGEVTLCEDCGGVE